VTLLGAAITDNYRWWHIRDADGREADGGSRRHYADAGRQEFLTSQLTPMGRS
jgi:hypothetical protein